jgi:YihY family inner membrane protein
MASADSAASSPLGLGRADGGAVNIFERGMRSTDRAQQRVKPAAFAFAVIKKFGDDRGGQLCALLTFYGFLSLFPLLLLLVTLLGFFSGAEHSWAQRVEHSAFSQFPIVGTKLSSNIHALHEHNVFALVIGILGVIWGSQGAMQTAQYAQAEIWHVPNVVRPNFWARLGRTMLMMLVLGVFLVAGSVLAGIVTIGHHGAWAVVGAVVVGCLLNVALFLVAFRVLTPKQIPWRDMVWGSVAGAIGWTVLQYVGGALVEHSLRNTSKEYGTFALVLGLVSFLFLAAQVTVYAAEINVVKARRLWPRTMVQPPLSEADRRVLSSLALESKRRPEQVVSTGFDEHGQPEDREHMPASPEPAQRR